MGIIHQIYKFRSTVILITAPILLLFLFKATSPDIYREIACAYTILLMAIYWVTEVVPLAVTALLPLVLYPLLGVVEARKVSIKYLKDVNVLFLGGLTVAIAVEHWNLHKRVALKVLTKVGAKPRWLLFGFMITTAFLSMWISNVATTAMMIPIAQAVLDELTSGEDKESSSDSGVDAPYEEKVGAHGGPQQGFLEAEFQKDESHIGTEVGSYNNARELGNKLAVTSGVPMQPLANGFAGGYQPVPRNDSFHKEDETISIQVSKPDTPTPPQTPLPSHSTNHLDVQNTIEDGESPVSSTTELISNKEKAQQTVFATKRQEKMRKGMAKALTICVCYAANIGGTATLTGTGPNLIMAGLFKETFTEAPEVDFGSWAVFAFPGMVIFLLICWLWLQFLFLDLNWREILPCCLRGKTYKKTAEEKRTEMVIQRQYQALGDMSFAETSVLTFFIILALLWLTRDPGFVNGWGSLPIFQTRYVTDATVAMLIAFILFVFPSRRPNFLCCRAKGDTSEAGPVPPLLTWKIVQQKMAWNVILLLGGGFAMAYGSEESGLSKLIGEQMKPLKLLPPFTANFICCLAICLMTQCTSNTATATVFLPILAELAKILGVNPLLLMLPSTVITSYAFMLPVSTPPNAIAYSYGHLSMIDMIKAGSLMNFVGIFIALFSVYVFGGPAFRVYQPCPEWVNSTICNSVTLLNSTTTPMSIYNTSQPLS